MIKSITLKNVATYNEVGVKFNDLKKINFIYGLNGTGKTTISNFLNSINGENNQVLKENFKDCTLTWENKNKPLPTLVYNKQFRESNFGKGKLNGIFTLGTATNQQLEEIESKTELLHKLLKEGKEKRATLEYQQHQKEQIEVNFKEKCWSKSYRKYKDTFKQAFTGAKTKDSFKGRVLQEFYSNNSALKSFEELEEKAKTIFDTSSDIIPSIKINLMLIDSFNDIENNPIWKKIIVGKTDVDIANLIQKLNMNDWINQGKKYIQEDKICPFCQQQTITEDFKSQLENYFDENYLKEINILQNLKKEYTILTKELIDSLNEIENQQKKNKDSKLNVDRFSMYLKTLISQNAHNNELLNTKIKEPSRSIELISLQEQFSLIEDLINNANDEIAKHNKLLNNFSTERKTLIKSIWKLIIEELRNDYNNYSKKINEIDTKSNLLHKERNQQLKEYENLNNQLIQLSENVTGIQPTIDEMNKILKEYNFLGFEIVPTKEKGFYQIQRQNGQLAENTLSEGEITFITFLYFLQLTKGSNSKENLNQERIIVIDDPVSNLDNKNLSVISTLLKELIKNIISNESNNKQFILLTHNTNFSKELSNSQELQTIKEDTRFWILKKNENVTQLQEFVQKKY